MHLGAPTITKMMMRRITLATSLHRAGHTTNPKEREVQSPARLQQAITAQTNAFLGVCSGGGENFSRQSAALGAWPRCTHPTATTSYNTPPDPTTQRQAVPPNQHIHEYRDTDRPLERTKATDTTVQHRLRPTRRCATQATIKHAKLTPHKP